MSKASEDHNDVPSQKEVKYDRQIRLWGMGGQKALEKAKICLINASGVGSETLKNLVLGGIGSFTIVDGQTVTHEDLGNNFFVTEDDLGQPRGERVAKWLLELNPDVKGSSLTEQLTNLLDNDPDYFRLNEFSLVISSQLPEVISLKLSRILEKDNIPLLLTRSYGMLGFLRLQIGDRAIIETFPDQQVQDFRILSPFPELQEFVQSVGDPDSMDDSMLHGHIPFVVLLIHYVNKWKTSIGNAYPPSLSYADRKEIQSLLKAGDKLSQDNFREAIAALHKINPPEIPKTLLDYFEYPEMSLSESSTSFWFCMSALKSFYNRNHRLPLNGKLADMTSTSEWFIALQNVYSDQSLKDQSEIASLVTESLSQLGKNSNEVPLEYIAAFCKNVWNLRYLKYRTLEQELSPATANRNDDLESNRAWYLLQRAADRFWSIEGRYPGDSENTDDDSAQLDHYLKQILSELSISKTPDVDYLKAFTRFCAAEVHNISSVVGGVAAQEAIKVITNQRVPVNNTLVYNGIECTMSTYEF